MPGRAPVIALLLVVGFYAVAGYVRSNQFIGNHPEWRRGVASPSDYGLQSELVTFPSTDGIPLKAWWLPADRQTDAQGRAPAQSAFRQSVILAHGKDDNRSGMLPRAAFLVRHGYSVLDIDLRNHGESSGNYMTPGNLEALDILGGVLLLRSRGERGPIATFGFSYGAVAALRAADQSPEIAAVIADSAFISFADLRQQVVSNAHLPMKSRVRAWLAGIPLLDQVTELIFRLRSGVKLEQDNLDTVSVVARIRERPILFISGERDWIVPPENARRMYAQAQDPRKALLIIPGAEHNTTYTAATQLYEHQVLSFLANALPMSQQ
jgi:pimeloyl-ACP methyl ester carboxylesterase